MSHKAINVLLIIFFVILVIVSLAISLIDWGWVKVHAHNGDAPVRISMPVPLNFAWFALDFIPADEIPREVFTIISANKEQLMQAIKELESIPDTVLVKVETPKEKVCIEKRGKSIFIDVHAEDADVEVTLPIRAFIKMLNKIESKATYHEEKREAC